MTLLSLIESFAAFQPDSTSAEFFTRRQGAVLLRDYLAGAVPELFAREHRMLTELMCQMKMAAAEV